jgi:hypothetical protein
MSTSGWNPVGASQSDKCVTTRLVIPIYKEEKVKAAPAKKIVRYKLYQKNAKRKRRQIDSPSLLMRMS